MDEGKAPEDAEAVKAGVASVKGRAWDGVCTRGPKYVTDVDQDEEGVSP